MHRQLRARRGESPGPRPRLGLEHFDRGPTVGWHNASMRRAHASLARFDVDQELAGGRKGACSVPSEGLFMATSLPVRRAVARQGKSLLFPLLVLVVLATLAMVSFFGFPISDRGF